jgi:tRNA pseudouridine38-40 synthase
MKWTQLLTLLWVAWVNLSTSYMSPNPLRSNIVKTKFSYVDRTAIEDIPHYHLKVDSGFTRLVSRVAYDGTHFHGFQFQINARSVQGVIEDAVNQVFNWNGKVPHRIVATGRTDALVHARGQVIHFDVPTIWNGIPIHNKDNLISLNSAINNLLPSDVCLWNVSVAPPSKVTKYPFHATLDSNSKIYSYRFKCMHSKHLNRPFNHKYRHLWACGEDVAGAIALLKQTFPYFTGHHNFCSFGNTPRPQSVEDKDYHKTIHDIRLIEKEGGCEDDFRIDLHLSGALYKMVWFILHDICLIIHLFLLFYLPFLLS